jgi:hypothetical protein
MFSAPGPVFGGTDVVGSRFYVLRSRTHFSLVPSASSPVFMFCAAGLIFGRTEGVGSRLYVLCSWTPFSFVPSASGPVFMFCAPGLFFGDTEGVRSRFHVLPRASGSVLKCCAPELDFDGTDGVRFRFHVLCSRNHFRRYRRRRVPFSCFALPDSFSAVPRASGPIFMFFALGPIFHGTDGVGCGFHGLRSKTQFRRYRGRRFPFSCFALPEPFSAVPSHRVPLSCFALLDSFSALPRASGAVFIFCAPRLDFGGTEGVGFRFHVLHSRTRFRRYRGSRVPILYFALPNSFSAVPRASSPAFCGTDGVGSRFLVLPSRAHFGRYRWRRVPFSSFALPGAFLAVPRASGLVFMFCAPGLGFGGTEGVGFRS